MSYFFKIILAKLPGYMYEIIPPPQGQYPGCFQTLRCRATLFQNLVLPITITEWNKFNCDIKNINSHAMFREKLLTLTRPLEK